MSRQRSKDSRVPDRIPLCPFESAVVLRGIFGLAEDFFPLAAGLPVGFFRGSTAEILRKLGVLAEGSIRPDGALEFDARLRHGRGDDVRIGGYRCRALVEQLAVGAPCIQGGLHRLRCDGLLEEAQRGLVGLQQPSTASPPPAAPAESPAASRVRRPPVPSQPAS